MGGGEEGRGRAAGRISRAYTPRLNTPDVSPARPPKSSASIRMHPEKHLPELMAEKNSLDPSFVHAVRLLAEGTPFILPLFFWSLSSSIKRR